MWIQRFLVPIFTFIWWNRLYDGEHRRHVVKVKNWKTVLVDGHGGRSTVSFMFWWNKE